MATDAAEHIPAVPNHADAIRVVPLASVHELGVANDASAAPVPPPSLTYRGGPVLGAVEVVTIFWGKAWQLAANQAMPGQLNSFFDAVLTSSVMDELAEYSTTSTTIGHVQLRVRCNDGDGGGAAAVADGR